MTKKFSAQVDDFIAKVERRRTAVFRTATQEVVRDMQTPIARGGNMPVDTGFLRNSLMSSLNGDQPVGKPGADADGGRSDGYELVVGRMEWGDTAIFGYTANYARAQEYGFGGQEAKAFVASAARKWKAKVRRAANRARSIK